MSDFELNKEQLYAIINDLTTAREEILKQKEDTSLLQSEFEKEESAYLSPKWSEACTQQGRDTSRDMVNQCFELENNYTDLVDEMERFVEVLQEFLQSTELEIAKDVKLIDQNYSKNTDPLTHVQTV